MRTLNLGILAHVDAGKTSLTERLLHTAGVIDTIGRVDDGTTQTDTLALERQRGITIKAAVVSFVIDDLTVNLIDTPGHPDFIAEVERVLGVLDGAILVVSAVEGVQSQTRILMRTLQRLRIPSLIFVNKIDRAGARYDDLLRSLAERLTPALVAMGSVPGAGTREAAFVPFARDEPAFVSSLAALLAENDEVLLGAYLRDEQGLRGERLGTALAAQSRRALVHPVFFGSAITGAGVDTLMTGIRRFLPADAGDPAAPLSATVFKVERGPSGEKIAYARLFSGTIRARDRVRPGEGHKAKVTAISVFAHGAASPADVVVAGEIGKLWGLADVRIGDAIGMRPAGAAHAHFARPSLESAVRPLREGDRGALFSALTQLAEQDPLIDVRQDDERRELHVSLYGEVQKDVIRATLAGEFGIEVEFRETTTICIERPAGVGAAFETKGVAPNPFLATVGLRVEPAAEGSGIAFRRSDTVLGAMPAAFFKAVEESIHDTLRWGLAGWQVTDCTVTMTHAGYYPRQSHAHQRFSKSMSSTGADFRGLTPLVLMAALAEAGTTVCEPMHRFRLEVPADAVPAVLAALARLDAVAESQEVRGTVGVIEGQVAAAHVHGLQQQLPGLTRGEGVLESGLDAYRPVRGTRPTRPRQDHNPRDRREYLLHVQRRV